MNKLSMKNVSLLSIAALGFVVLGWVLRQSDNVQKSENRREHENFFLGGHDGFDHEGDGGFQLGGYNGFYVSNQQEMNSFHYVRLYKEGAAIAVTSTGNPKQVDRWFNKSNPTLPKGRYSVKGNDIHVSVESVYGIIEYKGKINNGYLHLHSYSRINGHKGFRKYKLAKP